MFQKHDTLFLSLRVAPLVIAYTYTVMCIVVTWTHDNTDANDVRNT